MGIEFGPMSFDDLAGLVERGNLRPSDPVRNSLTAAWIKAAEVPGLVGVAPPALASAPVPSVASSSVASDSPAREMLAPDSLPDVEGESAVRGESASEADLLSLRQYNCAILIGPDGVSLCDLRGCQQVAIAGARVIGHRSGDDDSPIRFGAFELEISIREVGESAAPASHAVNPLEVRSTEQENVSSSGTQDEALIPVAARRTSPSKAAPRGASPGAETGDIAAEMLRRMFMPRPSNAR
jgi:hypothetical protein